MPLPCFPTSTIKPQASAIDSLMVLAEISTMDSNNSMKSPYLVQITTSSRSSTPGIFSDDNANLTKTGTLMVTPPNDPPMTFNKTLGKCNQLAIEPLVYKKKESNRIPSASDVHDTSSPSFLPNELLSTKFKRPKRKIGCKNPPVVTSSPSCEGYEKPKSDAQLEENLMKDMSIPQASNITKMKGDTIKLESSLFEDTSQEKLEDNVKVPKKKDSSNPLPPKTTVATNRPLFPIKLHDLLNSELTDPHIISWEDNGRRFKILHVDQFKEIILPRAFNHTSLPSFQRQLNLYGFKRVANTATKSTPPTDRIYFHEMFLRDAPELCLKIRRNKSKNNSANASLISDSDSTSAVNETSESQSSIKKRKKIDLERKTKREVFPKIELLASTSLQVNDESNDANSTTKFKLKMMPKNKSHVTVTTTEDRNVETSCNSNGSADDYTQWLAGLSQDSSHHAHSNKLQSPSVRDRVSDFDRMLAQQSSSPNCFSAPALASLLQLQQKRGQLLENLGLQMQPMLPNSGNLLNPLSRAALNASNIEFVKSLLNANNAKSKD